jgi:hypothetical protein
MNKVRFMYTRDYNWAPNGCLAISVNRDTNQALYGLSVRHPKDAVDAKQRSIKFDRKLAQSSALSRLESEPRVVDLPPEASQHDISTAVLQDLISDKKSPSRAMRFAKMWLKIRKLFLSDLNSIFNLN